MTETAQRSTDAPAGNNALASRLAGLRERFETVDNDLALFVPEPGRFNRLFSQAEELERRYPDQASRPPLHGLLVGVKDIFHVDGLPTRAGSDLPAEILAGRQGPAVDALLRAGALVAGKTRTTEFAFFAPAATKNPRNPAHTPGGSSSGSAAAVAAGLVPLALGTQTVGSIIRPAAFCGATGFKPTIGRVPTEGVIPFSPSADHVGLLAEGPETAALGLSVICQDWAGLPTAPAAPVLGVPDGPLMAKVEADALAFFHKSLDALRAAGCVVMSAPCLDDLEEIRTRHTELIAAEMAGVHQDWYPKYKQLYRPATAQLIEKGQAVPDASLPGHRESMVRLREELTRLMDASGLDAWVCPPTIGPAPRGLSSTGDPVMNLPWTHAGLPAVTLPHGLAANGLPLGVQLIGRFGRDEELAALSLRIWEMLVKKS